MKITLSHKLRIGYSFECSTFGLPGKNKSIIIFMFACGSQQDLYSFPLPCATGSAVPREGFNLSVIILASLLVFPM